MKNNNDKVTSNLDELKYRFTNNKRMKGKY